MNIKHGDKWLVLSPGRTGSKLIIDVLRNLYHQNGTELKYYDPTFIMNSIDQEVYDTWIYHAHLVENYIKFYNKNIFIVISTRDMVDSTLSFCVVSETKIWHRYKKNKNYNSKVIPFELNLSMFDTLYNQTVFFYEQISSYLKKYKTSNVTILKYQDFSDNPFNVIDLLNIENFKYSTDMTLPNKNPQNYNDFIINWQDVLNSISKYSRIPPI